MTDRIYLIRHADAVDLADDAARPLSRKGRHQLERLGRVLRSSEAFAPAEIWHSPLVRARETAELLRAETKVSAPLLERHELRSEADPAALVRALRHAPGALAVVGHEPHLSALGSLLVTGAAEPAVFVMKKAAVLALESAGARWHVRWLISPDVVG